MFRKWFLLSYEAALNEKLFFKWVRNKSGNVYVLLETYMEKKTGKRITVWPDAIACAGIHRHDLKGTWETWDKTPKWFNKWANGNFPNFKKPQDWSKIKNKPPLYPDDYGGWFESWVKVSPTSDKTRMKRIKEAHV